MAFRVVPLSLTRRRVQNYLRFSARHWGFAALATCDIECYITFAEACRVQKVRPPSLIAYVTRCLGAILQENLELLAVQDGSRLVIPSQVNLLMAVESTSTEGEKIPSALCFKDIGKRHLDDISREMTKRLREKNRERIPVTSPRFFPAHSPEAWQKIGALLKRRRGRTRTERLELETCVRLSSTTPWLQGRSGWGMPLYVSTTLGVTMGGIAKRALVVDDEIVARTCIDIALRFDHNLVDGAPATRFYFALSQEIESGRLLSEYPMVPRPSRTDVGCSAQSKA